MMIKILAMFAAALPFAFGMIRAISTGNDFRYLWVAMAAMCGGMLVTAGVRASGRAFGPPAVFGAVFVFAGVLAVIAALLLGTRLGPGILIVAGSFAGCFAVASALSMTARTH